MIIKAKQMIFSGNLILDGMVYENLNTGNPSEDEWAKSPIGFWNGGGIRNSLKKGLINNKFEISSPFLN